MAQVVIQEIGSIPPVELILNDRQGLELQDLIVFLTRVPL